MTEFNFNRIILFLLNAIIFILALCIFMKYILPCSLPFIFALASARLAEPAVLFFIKHFHTKRAFTSAAVLALYCIFLLFILFLFFEKIFVFLSDTLGNADFSAAFSSLFSKLGSISICGFSLSGLSSFFSALPARLCESIFSVFESCASCAPRCLIFIITYAISTFFFSSSFPAVKAFIMRQLPESKTTVIIKSTFNAVSSWLKAQLKLSGIIFLFLFSAFFILKIPKALLCAALTAMVDALPILGTGIVLIPWALYSLLLGSISRAAALLTCYFLAGFIRSLLEPKLLSQSFNIHPVLTLTGAYFGLYCFGFSGFIFFPITFLILKRLHDEGLLKLWK